jgi:prevent-host-death family protein
MGRSVSVRDLRNHTADVIRAVEAGEEVTLTVNKRPVATIVPPVAKPARWATRETVEAIVREAPADRALLEELRESDPLMDWDDLPGGP